MFVFLKKYELFLIWIRNLKYKKHFPNILKIFTTTTTKKDNVKLKMGNDIYKYATDIMKNHFCFLLD